MKLQNIKTNISDNRLYTIRWDAPMQKAYRLMEEKRIRHLPVVDDENYIVGILSNRDVNRAMSPYRTAFASSFVVADFMSWPALTVDEGAEVKDVIEGMIDEKISALIVTRKEKEAVGIITTEDLLKLLRDQLGKDSNTEGTSIPYALLVGEFMRELQAAGI